MKGANQSLDRTRAAHVSCQCGRTGPPASVSSGVGRKKMSLSELPGYPEIKSRFGDCGFGDFPDLRCLNVDTYYEEDRERFEKIVSLVLKGEKGVIEVAFGPLQGQTENGGVSD